MVTPNLCRQMCSSAIALVPMKKPNYEIFGQIDHTSRLIMIRKQNKTKQIKLPQNL